MTMSDTFIEDLIEALPLKTFEDVIHQMKVSYPILTGLAIDSYKKVDSCKWRILEKLIYKLNVYMFEHSSDLQMHGNLNRISNKAMIYHALCEYQEQEYTLRKYESKEEFITYFLKLITKHRAIKKLINLNFSDHTLSPFVKENCLTINPFLLANYFIEKARLVTVYYSPLALANSNIFNTTISQEEKSLLSSLKIKDGLFLDERFIHFCNETVRLTAYSRHTFAIGALIVLLKLQKFNSIITHDVTTISKELIQEIFHSTEIMGSICDLLNTDNQTFNNLYNGAKQALDSFDIFLDAALQIVEGQTNHHNSYNFNTLGLKSYSYSGEVMP